MVLMFHGLNTTSTNDNDCEYKDNEDTNDVMIRNKRMEEFDCFRQNSVSFPLYTADVSFNYPLEWWKKNQLKYLYLSRLACLYLAVMAISAPLERIWSRASKNSNS
jgi:hypothetical protein